MGAYVVIDSDNCFNENATLWYKNKPPKYSLRKLDEKIEIRYESTSFHDLIFTGYDLNNTEFLEVEFINCDFSQVYLSGSNLSGSTFEKCIFKDNMFKKGKAEYLDLWYF